MEDISLAKRSGRQRVKSRSERQALTIEGSRLHVFSLLHAAAGSRPRDFSACAEGGGAIKNR